MYGRNLICIALPVPEIEFFGWGLRTPNLGKERPWGSWMAPFEKALVTSYRPSIVTIRLSLPVSEILSLLCSIARHFPPPLVSPKFAYVPLGLGGLDGLWATKG